ncbi:dihydropteroate synthase-related protein [Methanococcoides vulcani]|uniref:Dihydropteroate synthase-related protein n=1 Tax=Methanococcoides vulcani TaxID=1353158 RepID=A0A1I0AFW7_9EURY|nr:dihydropteroate synthase-like protein [Methanococcoides vulcani]SES93178.1 dihydropteroate synthase-related protein [Methanococcoides vulcani]
MEILVATGKLAEKTVRYSVVDNADVLVLDIEVAAFLTPHRLLSALKKQQKKYDVIFVPGLCSGDFSIVAKELGCKVFLGPKHAYDLSSVLRFVDEIEFSLEVPACELLSDVWRDIALETLDGIEENAEPLMDLKNVKLGGASRMKVMAEVVNATGLGEETLSNRITSFIKKGADIIDLGASLTASSEDVKRAVRVARKVSTVPISIDTLGPELIKAALDEGVDLVLSLNSSNIDAVAAEVSRADVAAVVIPDAGEGFESLVNNIEAARLAGISNIIADPVLDPIGHGITRSIVRYSRFHEEYPDVPVFFGAGNVTELIDADSVGVNATLCGIAADVGSSILFTPEFSEKTRGSISELSTAAKMMTLAKERESSPKDLGIDLLCLKEKRRRPDVEVPEKYVLAQKFAGWELDPLGPFRIGIAADDGSGVIVAQHEEATIVGQNARDIMDTIMRMKLISKVDHASYLGCELEKAEIALRLGRSYSQDDDL